MSLAASRFQFNEDEIFIHDQEDNESVVMLHQDEDIGCFYRLTHFGVDVVRYIQDHKDCTFDEILNYLQPLYNGAPEDIKKNLEKVLETLKEKSIL